MVSIIEINWKEISDICVSLSLIVGVITYIKSKKIERMDFYFRIKKDFYSENCREFSQSIWEKTIFFEMYKGRPRLNYRVRVNNVIRSKVLSIDLLDTIEDLSFFYKDGLISKKLLYDGFGTVILITRRNHSVKRFIKLLKETDGILGEDYYTGLEKLYEVIKTIELKKIKKSRRRRRNLLN